MTSSPTDAKAEAAPDQARSAGRGGLAMLVANVYFILTGLVQQLLLPRAIGLADYGALARVLAVSNVFNNVIVGSSTQGVSRTVAAAGVAERQALRATLRVHLLLAILAAVLLAGAAPLVAYFEHASEMLAPLLVMTGVLFVYGVYAPLFGYLNGRGMFVRQAALNVVAATLRTIALLAVGWLFATRGASIAGALGTTGGVLGATLGTVGAALGVFLLALRWTGTGTSPDAVRPAGVPDLRTYLALIVPIMIAQGFTNALMQADIILLGRYLSLSAVTATLPDGKTATQAANEWVAVYRACQLFAFLPFQMLFSVTQVLFPMLAKAKAEEGGVRVPALVARGSRIGAIVCGMLVCVVLTLPGSLLKLGYTPDVAARGASALRVLALGQGTFAMVGLCTTVLISLGRERTALVVTALALALLAATCSFFIPLAPFGAPQLMTTATATTIAMGCALVVAVIMVRRAAGAFVPWKTALRVALCIAGAFVVGGHTPVFGKLITPVVAGGVVAAYLLALVVTGEIGKADLALVVSIAARKRSKG